MQISENYWEIKTRDELSGSLKPFMSEKWEGLYQRIHTEIFSSSYPLHQAASLGCEKVIFKLICQEECDVDGEDKYKSTPLGHAIDAGSAESVRMLLRLNADLSKRTCHVLPLNFAYIRGIQSDETSPNFEIVALLIGKVKEPDFDFFMQVVRDQRIVILNLLLRQGFNLNLCDKWGNTALHLIDWEKESKNDYKIAKWLIDHGADVNKPNEGGLTPLHVAIAKKDMNGIQFLLNHEASLLSLDKDGNSVLSWALWGGDPAHICKEIEREKNFRLLILGLRVSTYAIPIYFRYVNFKNWWASKS